MPEDIITSATATGTTSRERPHRLIASSRVEGTAVYNREGEKLGRIESFMVDKRTGKADYAVMSFGGLFGFGDDHYPLPWNALDYDAEQGGYVVDLTKEKLQGGPKHRAGDEPAYDRDYGRSVYDYYGFAYTW